MCIKRCLLSELLICLLDFWGDKLENISNMHKHVWEIS